MAAVQTERPRNMAALTERAVKARLARASVKRWIGEPGDLEESRERAVHVLLGADETVGRVEVHALLCMISLLGATRASKICRELKLRETKPIGELTDRQRNELVNHLRANVPVNRKPLVLFEESIA